MTAFTLITTLPSSEEDINLQYNLVSNQSEYYKILLLFSTTYVCKWTFNACVYCRCFNI